MLYFVIKKQPDKNRAVELFHYLKNLHETVPAKESHHGKSEVFTITINPEF